MSDIVADRPSTPQGSRGSLLVASGIALSRVAGLLREIILAAFLGSGPAVDAFTAASRIPNALQNLLGEGVLSASFIPSYSRLLAEGRPRDAGKVASTILTLLMLVTGLLVVLGVVAAGPITSLIAPGLLGENRELTVTLVSIITPGIGLLVASAWCLGVLNSHRRFFLSYVAPVLWNLAQIIALAGAGLLVFTDADVIDPSVIISGDARGLVLTLGWATVVGSALQLGIQLPEVRRLEPNLRPSLRLDPETLTVLQRFLPIVGARGVVQISAYIDTALATYLVGGGLASFRYASVLYLLPISIFGMSIAASELPELSSQTGRGDAAEAARAISVRLHTGLSRIAYFVVPTSIAFIAAGDLIVGGLLQRGQFVRSDTLQVWAIIGTYALGLLAATVSRLLQSALYGLGDTRTPARASLIRVGVAVAVGVILMFQLDRVGIGADGLAVVGDLPAFGPVSETIRAAADAVPRIGAAGLSLGVSVAAWVELHLLRTRLSRIIGPIDITGGVRDQTLGAALAAVGTTFAVRLLAGGLPQLLLSALTLSLAAIVYLLVSKQLGFPLARALSGHPPDRSASARRSRRGGP
ncbi:MAG: murein biosynthesis integral membrane protein MurJ [Euzebya sp.]